MKPTEIKKSILSLNKKSIANLSDSEMNQINGGMATKPTLNTTTTTETAFDCPCTHFCEPTTK
jgi:bacteriocin-like protein